jgi:ribonuclease HII
MGLFPDPALRPDPICLDRAFRQRGYGLLAGLDEAGRGPLAGPVVAAAVVLSPQAEIRGLTDSKVLSPREREGLFEIIRAVALTLGVGTAEPEEIDRINILQATRRAMERAVEALDPRPHALLIDGKVGIVSHLPQFPIVKGDARSQSIAAASVVAKVTRDRIMAHVHERFPQYGFARHKGYGTPEHLEALRRHGCCPLHRRSFRGVLEGPGPGTDEGRGRRPSPP